MGLFMRAPLAAASSRSHATSAMLLTVRRTRFRHAARSHGGKRPAGCEAGEDREAQHPDQLASSGSSYLNGRVGVPLVGSGMRGRVLGLLADCRSTPAITTEAWRRSSALR